MKNLIIFSGKKKKERQFNSLINEREREKKEKNIEKKNFLFCLYLYLNYLKHVFHFNVI